MLRRPRPSGVTIVVAIGCRGLLLSGCTGALDAWSRPGASRSPASRSPFENQTPSVRAGAAVADILVAELIARGTLRVIDPGAMNDLLRRDTARLPGGRELGRPLGATHVLHGSVTEYRYKVGVTQTPVVGLTARVIDVATGDVVWSAADARSASATCSCSPDPPTSARCTRAWTSWC